MSARRERFRDEARARAWISMWRAVGDAHRLLDRLGKSYAWGVEALANSVDLLTFHAEDQLRWEALLAREAEEDERAERRQAS